jgi:phosphoribosyl-ATP pyrophosphohydrolase/phosphoribosyl-AMP cyclohydrolase
MKIDIDAMEWEKGLIPAVVQDAANLRVLMVGYMDRPALKRTLETGKVTFFSRSKQRLWVKGETSGHFLEFVSGEMDCDKDTLLIKAKPQGPACHLLTETCFNNDPGSAVMFLETLTALIAKRNAERPEDSYTTKLFKDGKLRIAQKVGEEGVELALAAATGNKDGILNESADLLFHLMVLLEDAGLRIDDVCDVLKARHNKP